MAIVTIGAPLINTQVYVLDPQFQPVPVGVAGELYISGAGVGCGYLHDPLRTSLAFRPNPFAASPGSRMYKTGDLARFRADGTLEFLGRLDHQVKIRGFRIELGEIETTLNQHPDIQASVVVAHKNPALILLLTSFQSNQKSSAGSDVTAVSVGVVVQIPDTSICTVGSSDSKTYFSILPTFVHPLTSVTVTLYVEGS